MNKLKQFISPGNITLRSNTPNDKGSAYAQKYDFSFIMFLLLILARVTHTQKHELTAQDPVQTPLPCLATQT